MNQLEVSLQEAIHALQTRGWSQRRIARELKLDRRTVAGYARAAKPAISTPGSGPAVDASPATPCTPSAEPEAAKEGKPAISTPGFGGPS